VSSLLPSNVLILLNLANVFKEMSNLSQGKLKKGGYSKSLAELVLPSKPAFMEWKNLRYTVKTKRFGKNKHLTLLHDVCGYVKPGMLLALMVQYHHPSPPFSPLFLTFQFI